jgi:hypothetical protein
LARNPVYIRLPVADAVADVDQLDATVTATDEEVPLTKRGFAPVAKLGVPHDAASLEIGTVPCSARHTGDP